jgi:hypothetical protein
MSLMRHQFYSWGFSRSAIHASLLAASLYCGDNRHREAGQTIAAASVMLAGEESPGSIEQNAG